MTPSEIASTISGEFFALRSERPILKGIFLMFCVILFTGEIYIFSMMKAQQSRIEQLGLRIERMDKSMGILIGSQKNALQIEKIEQRVNGMSHQLTDLQEMLVEESPKEVTKSPKKKSRSAKPKKIPQDWKGPW